MSGISAIKVASTSIKGAAGTSIATGSVSAAGWMSLIPDDIAKLGALVGLVATIILTTTAIYSRSLQNRKTLLEIQLKYIEIKKSENKQ